MCICVCGCVWVWGGFDRPRGPGACPPIQCGSLHYPLYLSICPSVQHCLYPAAHLAVLLASLPHTASIAALLWVTFKDRLLLINRETAALYSVSVLSLSLSLPCPPPLPRSPSFKVKSASLVNDGSSYFTSVLHKHLHPNKR